MHISQFDSFQAWFTDYSRSFNGDDPFVNANLKLKADHTHRVCRNMEYLTSSLGLAEAQSLLARTIALFHDVGRYRQFSRYRTFSDAESVPHGPLAVEVLRDHNVLDALDDREKLIIEEAITLHAVMAVSDDIDEESAFFARLIRDADKLDIYHLVTEVDNRPRPASGERLMINWFEQGEGYSPEVVSAVLNRRPINYRMLKTNNDMKIMQVAWVYDLNFAPTFARVKKKRYLEQIIDMLPRDEDIGLIARQVLDYVEGQLSKGINNEE